MIRNKFAQFSVIELSFVFLLFIFSISFFSAKSNVENVDYGYSVESFLDSIYYSEDFRSLMLDEDLSNGAITEDWSSFEEIVGRNFNSYSIAISNLSISKNIATCTGDFKYVSERLISIENNDNFEFRMISLGVCY